MKPPAPTPASGNGMTVHVLGCASARPSLLYSPPAQLVQMRGKSLLLDCGEGTQFRLMQERLPIGKICHIFISHLHGDHCLGLPGLLSTMTLIGLRRPIHIYGPTGTAAYVGWVSDFFCRGAKELIQAHEASPQGVEVIYEEHSLKVSAIALKHRVPTNGYLIEEKKLEPHLDREAAERYGVPVAYFRRIKQGEGYTCPDGTVITHEQLTRPARPPYRYAYCSDTAYHPSTVPYIAGVDLLYHEATFGSADAHQAHERGHSTAHEAALMAQEAAVGHLLIGHYSSRYKSREAVEELRQEAARVFPRVIAAEDGLCLEVEALRRTAERSN